MKEIPNKELTKEIISVLAGELKVERRFHEGWVEYQRALAVGSRKIKIPFYNIFGKYQYIYSSKKGNISLVKFNAGVYGGKVRWEILNYETKLFDDVIKFDTKKEAVEMIKGFLL